MNAQFYTNVCMDMCVGFHWMEVLITKIKINLKTCYIESLCHNLQPTEGLRWLPQPTDLKHKKITSTQSILQILSKNVEWL